MSKKRRNKIPQGEFQATIHALSHEGRGIADIEGKKVFIRQALVGETVDFKYQYVRKQFAEGQALAIENPSKDRVEPVCPHTLTCGGCSLQHMDVSAQLAHKQASVVEMMKAANAMPNQILEPMVGPTEQYRTKARLGVRYVPKKGGALVGFREPFSSKVADIDSCEVLDPSVGKLLPQLKTLVSNLSIKAELPQIEVAIGEDQKAIIVRHLKPLEGDDLTQVSAFCKEYGLSLYSQSKGYDSVKKIYPEDGKFFLHYSLKEQGLKFAFHPLDFTQVNTHINQNMITKAIDLLELGDEDTVLDLFCGIGNFTLPLAQKAKHVVGVEGSDTAIERAQYNAKANGLENVEFYVDDLFQSDDKAEWANKTFEKVLLDPPRSGAANVLEDIKKLGAKTIVYVSCNPSTLARDAGVLVNELGYTFESLQVMDMFPHTAHVESMALFKT